MLLTAPSLPSEGFEALKPVRAVVTLPRKVKLAFAAITYNALTLQQGGEQKPGPWGSRESGRIKALQEQAFRLSALLVGVQEARTQGPATRRNSDWLGFISGCALGGYAGVELWVVRSCPGCPTIAPKHVTAVYSDPRILLVAIRAPMLAIDVVVAHALDSSYSQEEIEAWWAHLSAVCRWRRDKAVPMIPIIDGNARVGSVASIHVGEHRAQIEDASGELLHAFLQEFDLVLLATWVSSSKALHRIDHVAVQRSGSCGLRGPYLSWAPARKPSSMITLLRACG